MKKVFLLLLAMLVMTGSCLAASGSEKTTSIQDGQTVKDVHGGDKKMVNRIAVFETNLGNFSVELFEDQTPITTENFIDLAEKGFYDGVIFHRVIDGFMIQGGGFEAGMQHKEGHAPIENEAMNGLKNDKYTIAMARTSDPHSATSQFFINVSDNDFLNHTVPSGQGWGYAVFGRVVKGFDVIDRIAKVKTGSSRGFQDVPKEDVVIEKAEII